MSTRKPLYYAYVTDEEDREITQLLQSVMDGQAKSIAFKIGCSHQDLLNRVSNQPRSPRKLEMVLKILDYVADPEPFIRWINARYGFQPPTRIPEITLKKEPLFAQMARVSKEMGDVSRELLCAYEDNIIDETELQCLHKEITDLVQSALELSLAIEHEANNGG